MQDLKRGEVQEAVRLQGVQTVILGDPGADSRGERQVKRTKSVRTEAWCERKFTRQGGNSPGRIPLTD